MAERGRPSIFTEELATRICERLAAGESLRAICEDGDMPSRETVRVWAFDNEEFSGRYARARRVGYLDLADEIIPISDNEAGDPARDRLKVDSRKWILAKMLPKVYGEKTALIGGGEDDPAVRVITEIRRSIVDPRHTDG